MEARRMRMRKTKIEETAFALILNPRLDSLPFTHPFPFLVPKVGPSN